LAVLISNNILEFLFELIAFGPTLAKPLFHAAFVGSPFPARLSEPLPFRAAAIPFLPIER
jgi:hypothetical protein